ncbi:rod shape-determining protein MreC [Synechococcus sp. OH30]|uniref:rod shape-determining protein MreC n=1 Tax=Synechococcus sp. H65.1 TaxID=2964525 RepID=UPI0039C165CF
MGQLRQWWRRKGWGLLLSALAIGAAVGLRQTKGSLLVELYTRLTALARPAVDPEEVLRQAASRELQALIVELQHQNRELRRLLQLAQQGPPQVRIPAAVVGRSADHWWQQLTLDRGSQQGVKVGDVVVAPGGLIGRVEAVTPNSSRVLLISDPTSRVGVMLSRSRQMGILRGTGSQEAILDFFDKNPQVEVGDVVVTSGLSSLYPPGIVVGTVRAVNLDASPAPQATVELSAPLGFLEWALVYPYVQPAASQS